MFVCRFFKTEKSIEKLLPILCSSFDVHVYFNCFKFRISFFPFKNINRETICCFSRAYFECRQTIQTSMYFSMCTIQLAWYFPSASSILLGITSWMKQLNSYLQNDCCALHFHIQQNRWQSCILLSNWVPLENAKPSYLTFHFQFSISFTWTALNMLYWTIDYFCSYKKEFSTRDEQKGNGEKCAKRERKNDNQ